MNRRADMSRTIGAMLDATLPEAAAIAQLQAMDLAALTADALAGAVDAVMARAVPFPTFSDAIDCCGTGGDGLHTLNISTAVALVASACGLTIAKHGNRAVSSHSGSADVLEALGVRTHIAPQCAAECLRMIGLAFLFAPSFHPGFANVARIRQTIGKRTIFNLLGPLCNPARPQRQLIGVFAAAHCDLLAQTAKILGYKHLTVVHGDDGSDEISITSPTHGVEWIDGALRPFILHPQDAGLPVYPAAALRGGDVTHNANALRQLLQGEPGAYADAVALNAAMLLRIAGKVATLAEGVGRVKSVIADGRAAEKLEQLVKASNA